ncbi:hypothetical protein QJ043_05810 [Olsenella sp. YH-ols2217]|uniref:Uncharacterized protein n=1 Tax=Kribbibacterium absianum TaxID=3044210 RepID=A0ABT6ZLQ9_9ACTN|nr:MULTISPECIES: hypothetical protein [unclassified Olsenella]MDJ1121588.1 hypothetical protein [Olsenella sp. YH-ols2216]MDJ1129596.1 hypothetical protein [Olsenella sp. YH-ols2217]
MNELMKETTRVALDRAHAAQLKDTIPPELQVPAPAGSYNLFVFFNEQAAYDEGHAVLGLGPVGGDIMTYSYYRHGNALKGPGLMACLEAPEPFERIVRDSGWIVHGNPGNYWNEHMDVALAMWCDRAAYEPIRAFAEAKKADPGEYDLITYNCLSFCEQALGEGGVALLDRDGRPSRTFVPRDAFADVRDVSGAHRWGAWKYWFPQTPAPENGLRFISDFAAEIRPGSNE